MPKDQKVYKDRSKYINTQQTETYRQQLAKERRILAPKTNADIEKLEPYFHKNNNYLALLKKNPEQGNEDAIRYEHPLDQLGQVQYNYCQKIHRDMSFNRYENTPRLDQRKTQYNYTTTSNQTYGWLPPIDNQQTNLGLKSMLGQFTTSFRTENKSKPQ